MKHRTKPGPLARVSRFFSTRSSVLLPLAGLLLLVAVSPFLPGWIIFLLTMAFAKALVVVGVVLLLRGGLVTFGHGMYFAAGAYVVGFAMKELGVREALLLSVLGTAAGAILAAVFGILLARYRTIFFAMLSLAFSMVLYAILLKFYWVTGGTDGMGIRLPTLAGSLPPLQSLRLIYYYFTLGITVVVFYVAYRISISPLGYLMTAIRDNEIRVAYMGASVPKTIYFTFVLSGALGGLGGSLAAFNVGHIVPDFSYWTQSGEFVFVALLGGYRNVLAPLAGSIIFEFVRSYAFKFSPYTWQLSLGAILLLIIFFLPGGLWSLFEAVARWWTRWALSWKR